MARRDSADDVTLYDIDPAFQNRLLKWLTKYNAVVDVAAEPGREMPWEITIDSAAFRAKTGYDIKAWPGLEEALVALMDSGAQLGAIDPEFERRVADWLHAHNAHLTFGADGKEFVVAVADAAGGRGEATDIDFEVALALAEDEWALGVVQAVALDEIEPETLALPTRHMPPRQAYDVEPETLAAPTKLFDRPDDLDVTLPSETMLANKKWTRAHIDRLPDTAFLYVESGGQKHDGRTHPLSLRHFPYKNAQGRVDRAHLKNALGRIPQSALPETVKRQTKAKAEAIFDREFAANPRTPPPPPLPRRHGAFDPAAPREHYAKPHHFAVNEDEDTRGESRTAKAMRQWNDGSLEMGSNGERLLASEGLIAPFPGVRGAWVVTNAGRAWGLT